MNLEAFDNLKRVLRTVPEGQLQMQSWTHCAIGHASRDPWFQERGLLRSFASAERAFGVHYRDAVTLFSARAGDSPEQVIATIDRFIGSVASQEAELAARRQAIIDQMLKAAIKVERAARTGIKVLIGAMGL
jgi:hypothetical protein